MAVTRSFPLGYMQPQRVSRSANAMRKNAWTTLEEFDFLTERIPLFHSAGSQGYGNVALFLGDLARLFLIQFPVRLEEYDRSSMTKVCFRWMDSIAIYLCCLEIARMVWQPHPKHCEGNGRPQLPRPLRTI